jgi:hypothetical protein
MPERINYTPSPEVDEAIKRLIVKVKKAEGLEISRNQALGFFASRGVASWNDQETKLQRRKRREPKEPGGSGAQLPSV